MGESSLSANMVPGFALATQEIASNYARFVTTAPVLQALPANVARQIETVSASPIPGSNIVRVEATAKSQGAALAAASEASTALVKQVADLSPEQSATNTLTRLGKLSRDMTATQEVAAEAQSQIGEFRGSSLDGAKERLGTARERLARANARLSTLQAQQNALNALYQSQVGGPPQSSLQLVNQARVTGNDFMSRLQLYALGAGGVGGMIGLLLVRRRDRKAAIRAQSRALLATGGPGRLIPPVEPADPHLVHLDATALGDDTQLLGAGGRNTQWETPVPTWHRAADPADEWPARLRR